MATMHDTAALSDWLGATLGARPADIALDPLVGATSSTLYRVAVRGQPRWVVRVLDNAGWLANEPDLAAHEAAALDEAARLGVGAPRCLAFAPEPTGALPPRVLMTLVPGAHRLAPPVLRPYREALAATLARIHVHRPAAFPWAYRSWLGADQRTIPAWAAHPSLWAAALEVIEAGPPDFTPVFIHRDYHPTNVLWHDTILVSVVDWINACVGPAAVDVAHCATNLTSLHGPAEAMAFIAAYRRANPAADLHPYWFFEDLFNMCLPTPLEYPPWETIAGLVLPATLLGERAEGLLAALVEYFL